LGKLREIGMGAVYKPRHTMLDTIVAVKVLYEERDATLRKEAGREA